MLYVPLEQLTEHPERTSSEITTYLGATKSPTGGFFHTHQRVRFDYSKVFANWADVQQLLVELAPGCSFSFGAGSLAGVPAGGRDIAIDKLLPE